MFYAIYPGFLLQWCLKGPLPPPTATCMEHPWTTLKPISPHRYCLPQAQVPSQSATGATTTTESQRPTSPPPPRVPGALCLLQPPAFVIMQLRGASPNSHNVRGMLKNWRSYSTKQMAESSFKTSRNQRMMAGRWAQWNEVLWHSGKGINHN